MRTILRSQTQTIAIAAAPDTVLALVADPAQLPRWAPGFASAVRRDGDHWIVVGAEGEQRVRIRVDATLGTVDFLAPDREFGAYSRVVANAQGSEFMFTVFFPPEATDDDLAEQHAIVADELAAVRTLCES